MKFSARAIAKRAFSPFQPIGWLVSVMSKARDWTVDRQREVRIRDLRARLNAAHLVGNRRHVQRLGAEMFAECDARSPAQVARMERRVREAMDEHMREALGR